MDEAGLFSLERRVRAWLDAEASVVVRLHWGIDGRLLFRLRVERKADGLRWTWLDDADATRVRRESVRLEELERILARQLLEPGGERLLLYRNAEEEPSASFRALVCAGDRLECVWE